MFKILAITCIFLALSSVYTQECTSTRELRTLYGFGNTVTNPTAASGVNYCKSIKSSNVCCTPSEINSISDKSDKIVANLTSLVSARDGYLKNVKTNVVPQLLSNINEFVPIAQDFSDFVESVNLTGVSGYDELADSIGTIIDLAGFLLTNLSTIKTNYVAYQKARTSCVVEMVSLQNAAYCLACDPNAANKGYSYTNSRYTFNVASSVCTRLKSSCSAYIGDSIGQNVLITSSYYASFLNILGTTLQTLMTGNLTAINTLVAAMENMEGPKTQSLYPAAVPQGCNGGSCDWICNGLFSNGQVNQLSLVLGGEIEDGSRRLSESNNRMLANGNWSPDRDESGVTVTFKDDPADTNNSNSGMIIGNVFMTMMVVISAILLF